MITCESLRAWIDQTESWNQLSIALGSQLSEFELKRTANLTILRDAYGAASAKSPELRARLHKYAIPDWESIGEYSDFSLLYHLESGLTDAWQVSTSISTHATNQPNQLVVFDFGAGLCRILRYLAQFAPEHRYIASEVNSLAVAWGRATFPEAQFLHALTVPPLDLPTSCLDVVYAWSIFSHFTEDLHSRWLKEIARLLKPGGIFLATVQGYTIADRLATDEQTRIIMRLWEPRLATGIRAELDTRGYSFYPSYAGDKRAPILGIDPGTFGMSFISESYIREHWSSDFELLSHEPGKISQWQDYVVLRRR